MPQKYGELAAELNAELNECKACNNAIVFGDTDTGLCPLCQMEAEIRFDQPGYYVRVGQGKLGLPFQTLAQAKDNAKSLAPIVGEVFVVTNNGSVVASYR